MPLEPNPQGSDPIAPDPGARCDLCGAHNICEIAGRNLCATCYTTAGACCSGDETAD